MSVLSIILGQVFIRKLFAFAGLTLLFYDYLLTVPLEVAHFWNAPWTGVKALFLINRYANLVGQTFIVLEETGYLSQGSQRFCTAFQLYLPFFAVFSGESIRFLIVMRACAIRRCKHSIAIILNAIYVLYGIAVLVASVYLLNAYPVHFEYLGEIGLCFAPVGPDAWALWLVSICLDCFVFAISRLIRLLTRDAILFYCAALFNSLFSIACWTVYRQDPRNFIATVISFPILSVVGQRVVLNLRRLRARPDSTRDLSREVNRQMAAIGAELSSWSPESEFELDDLGEERGGMTVDGLDSLPESPRGRSEGTRILSLAGRANQSRSWEDYWRPTGEPSTGRGSRRHSTRVYSSAPCS